MTKKEQKLLDEIVEQRSLLRKTIKKRLNNEIFKL